MFEGEYKNGGRWKGKQYYSKDSIEYEGEYLYGRYNGKGKEYFDNGKALFEGEFLDNHKWNGIGYDSNGNIIYKIINGNCEGDIKIYYSDGTIDYEGGYKNGLKHGKGKKYGYQKTFESEYLFGLKNGKGKEYDEEGKLIFEGEYFQDNKHGKGKEYDKDGKLIFEGEYSVGKKNGIGKEYDKDGKLIYEGYYVNNEKMIKTLIFHENINNGNDEDDDNNNDDIDDNNEN